MTTNDFYANESVGLQVNDEFERVRQQGYSVELGDTISKGWVFMKPQIWSLMGFVILAFIILVVLSTILGLIPIVGNLLNGAISTIVFAGFYYFFIKLYKERFATFSDFFEGFQDATSLGIAGLLTSLITYIPLLVVVGVGYLAFDFANLNFSDPNEIIQIMQDGIMPVLIGLVVIPVLLISVLYTFTIPIIVTNKFSPWRAMEASRKLAMANYSGVLGFILVLSFINIAGALPCGLGLLVTIPLTFASIFILYTKIAEKNGGGRSDSFFYGDEKAPLDAI